MALSRFGRARAGLRLMPLKPSRRFMVSSSVLPTTPPSVEYALTQLGRELVPAITA